MFEEELDVYLKMENEKSESYSEAILEEVNIVHEQLHLQKNKPSTSGIIIQQDQPASSTRSEPAINNDNIQFVWFKEMYAKTIEWEDHISCDKAAEIAGDVNNELRNSFEDFQRILRRVSV